MTNNPDIYNTLINLAQEAHDDRIDGLFVVDVRRGNDGEPFTSVRMFAKTGSSEQVARITEHLRGIADALGEIYAGEEVKG